MAGLYSDVRKAIRTTALASLSEFTNPQVIFSHTSGTEPAESYVVVNILSIEQQGKHMSSTLAELSGTYGYDLGWGQEYSESDATYKLSIQVAYEVLVQLSFIGSLSGDMAHSFTQRINNNPVALEELKKNKLGVMRKSQIRRAPQKRDTKWVEYHNMDVTFNYIAQTQQTIDIVEGVVIADETSEIPVIIKIPESIIYP